jgi:hypothetical protein
MKNQGITLRPVFFVLKKEHIDDIAGYGPLDKNHFSLPATEAPAFRSKILDQEFLNYRIFSFSSHGAKLGISTFKGLTIKGLIAGSSGLPAAGQY